MLRSFKRPWDESPCKKFAFTHKEYSDR
uniref:Uncharacterized protein n=1 Tax=Arundo donax TaxID=35708 RepID=A0A0A9EMK4_ARUDO